MSLTAWALAAASAGLFVGLLLGCALGFLGLAVLLLGGFAVAAVNRQRVLLIRARAEGRRLRREADWPGAGGGEADADDE